MCVLIGRALTLQKLLLVVCMTKIKNRKGVILLYPGGVSLQHRLKVLYLVILQSLMNGAPNTIRTCDPRLRRAVLYPAELWALLI